MLNIDDTTNEIILKVSDFGLSTKVSSQQKTTVLPVMWCAPELLAPRVQSRQQVALDITWKHPHLQIHFPTVFSKIPRRIYRNFFLQVFGPHFWKLTSHARRLARINEQKRKQFSRKFLEYSLSEHFSNFIFQFFLTLPQS